MGRDGSTNFRPDIFGHAPASAWANYARKQAGSAASAATQTAKSAAKAVHRPAGSTNFSPNMFGAAPPTNRWQPGERGASHGAKGVVRDWIADSAAQYANIHPGNIRDFAKSDVAKATFRTSMGQTAQTMIQRRLKRAQKKGGIVSNMLYNFANIAMAGMMRRLKDDQTTFENVARVRRGDPDVYQMSHNELRSVLSHAAKYGGRDAADIHAKATSELTRRWDQKASEHAGYDQKRYEHLQAVRDVRDQEHARNAEVGKKARREERDQRRRDVLKQQMDHRQALHEQKLKHRMELRTVSGHGDAARAGVQAQLKQAAGTTPSKGSGKAKPRIVGQTKTGKDIIQYGTGTKKVASKEESARARKGGPSGGVKPARRTRR